MPADLVAIRQAGILAGLGGSIVVISVFILIVTLNGIVNGSIPYDDNIRTIVLSLAGIVVGGAILAASLLRPKHNEGY